MKVIGGITQSSYL